MWFEQAKEERLVSLIGTTELKTAAKSFKVVDADFEKSNSYRMRC